MDKVFVYGNYGGARVGPGEYRLLLSLDGAQSETSVRILPDPKVTATAAEFAAQQQILVQIENTIRDIHQSVNQMRSAKKQVEHYAALLKDNEKAKALLEKGKSIAEHIKVWEENLIQPKQKTFQDVINFNNQLNAQLMHLKGFVDAAEPKVTQGARERLSDLLQEWAGFEKDRDKIINEEMATYNQMYSALGLPAIIMDE